MDKPRPKSKKSKHPCKSPNYEVSFISKDNIIRISKNPDILLKKQKKEEQIERFKQLINYEIDFINYFNNDQYFIAYLSNKSICDLAIRIFERFNRCKNYDQYLNYETVIRMDNFFLTILTFVNTELNNNPIVPLFYLIHEKNDLDTHLNFWNNFILKKISSYRLPISFNIKDQLIKEVILKCLNLDCKLYFCSNNIYRIIKNYKEINNLQFIDCTENLIDLNPNTISEFKNIYDESKEVWPKNYLDFFQNEIEPLILSNLKRNKSSNFNLSKAINLNSNFSFNFRMNKDCLTDLIWRLYCDSCEFIISFNQLYEDDKKIMSKYIEFINVQNYKNTNTYLNFFNPSINQLFHFQIADLIVRNELIYEKDSKFYVKSPFNEVTNIVTEIDKNGNTDCTCTMKQNRTAICAHRIAVKIYFEYNHNYFGI